MVSNLHIDPSIRQVPEHPSDTYGSLSVHRLHHAADGKPLPEWSSRSYQFLNLVLDQDKGTGCGFELTHDVCFLTYVLSGEIALVNSPHDCWARAGHYITGCTKGMVVSHRAHVLHFLMPAPMQAQRLVRKHAVEQVEPTERDEGIELRSLWDEKCMPEGPGCQAFNGLGLLPRHKRRESHSIVVVTGGSGFFAYGTEHEFDLIPVYPGSVIHVPADIHYGFHGSSLSLFMVQPRDVQDDMRRSLTYEFPYSL